MVPHWFSVVMPVRQTGAPPVSLNPRPTTPVTETTRPAELQTTLLVDG